MSGMYTITSNEKCGIFPQADNLNFATSSQVDLLKREANTIVSGESTFTQAFDRFIENMIAAGRVSSMASKKQMATRLRRLVYKADIHGNYIDIYRTGGYAKLKMKRDGKGRPSRRYVKKSLVVKTIGKHRKNWKLYNERERRELRSRVVVANHIELDGVVTANEVDNREVMANGMSDQKMDDQKEEEKQITMRPQLFIEMDKIDKQQRETGMIYLTPEPDLDFWKLSDTNGTTYRSSVATPLKKHLEFRPEFMEPLYPTFRWQ